MLFPLEKSKSKWFTKLKIIVSIATMFNETTIINTILKILMT